ncbi:MAG TPA: chemotaxis protein CheB [Solirubrobacteraceae bacterium]|nr:chemotaxis protein CheB [Solirubrobacteraceae bacterium]
MSVLLVEDSPLERRVLAEVLEADGRIRVVATASSAAEALGAAERHRPQVITMDLELLGGGGHVPAGIQAIAEIMRVRAVPILVLSAHVQEREDRLAVEALAAGAADLFAKPGRWSEREADQLRRRVLVLSRVPMTTLHSTPAPPPSSRAGTSRVIGIVASTGGPATLRTVISPMVGVPAPILLVQHIHPSFVRSFGQWLEDETGVPVRLAVAGELPEPGTVYLAPPRAHLRLGDDRRVVLDPEPSELLNRPSGDELLSSIARVVGARGIGCVLTGMGSDGADGLAQMRSRGALTFAQDGASAVVDGMPRAARDNGAAQRVLPPEQLGPALVRAARA